MRKKIELPTMEFYDDGTFTTLVLKGDERGVQVRVSVTTTEGDVIPLGLQSLIKGKEVHLSFPEVRLSSDTGWSISLPLGDW